MFTQNITIQTIINLVHNSQVKMPAVEFLTKICKIVKDRYDFKLSQKNFPSCSIERPQNELELKSEIDRICLSAQFLLQDQPAEMAFSKAAYLLVNYKLGIRMSNKILETFTLDNKNYDVGKSVMSLIKKYNVVDMDLIPLIEVAETLANRFGSLDDIIN